ncbi:integrase core domain-containing protein [Pseudomonas sp. SCB32]|uniref:integrase core domain-containing protein n=1 Tax=Pseudomonas sp. SCB32 TaxID=2653853 RepID=UPI0012655FEA|nr:integrase core domain-containing protein [Pseudomonas sp. SCB32]
MFWRPVRQEKREGWKHPQAKASIRTARKPAWIIDELIRLKALMPTAGCRRMADTFNRLHAQRRQITVSKSFVAYMLRRERYAVECKRRELRRLKPSTSIRNTVWALDLTGKQDIHGQRHNILGLIDHGTRRLLDLRALPDKSAWTLLEYLFLAIGQYGKPQAIRTDNERVFTGKVFTQVVRWAGIRHQRSEVGCPWQNGRIERLFGTLKRKLDQWHVANGEQLQTALQTFGFWYNAVRPHQSLNGRTPLEAWSGVDPYQRIPKRVEWFEAWEGLLTGFYLSG